VAGIIGSGKKLFHKVISGSAVAYEPFFVTIIAPVIHYCMGGLEITADSLCPAENGKPNCWPVCSW
jgi:succinate dehydrogenase/fumarate reductase flavoprotein subunit